MCDKKYHRFFGLQPSRTETDISVKVLTSVVATHSAPMVIGGNIKEGRNIDRYSTRILTIQRSKYDWVVADSVKHAEEIFIDRCMEEIGGDFSLNVIDDVMKDICMNSRRGAGNIVLVNSADSSDSEFMETLNSIQCVIHDHILGGYGILLYKGRGSAEIDAPVIISETPSGTVYMYFQPNWESYVNIIKI